MAWLKSFKKFLKTPACGCTKKTKKNKKSKSSRGKRSRAYKGGYVMKDGKAVSSPHSISGSKSRSKSSKSE